MAYAVIVLIVLSVCIGIQVFLSLRKNRFFGLILPGLNLLLAGFVSTQFSDMIMALLGFAVALAPMVIWLSIYRESRKRIEQKAEAEIERMRINDL